MTISDKEYNMLLNSEGASSVSQWMNQDKEKIHKLLLNSALVRLWNSNEYDWTRKYDIIDLDIIEHRNDSYKDPSVCTFKTKGYPMRTWKVDMKRYWDNEYLDDITKESALNVNNHSSKDDEIVKIDYVNNLAKLRSRLTGVEYTIPLDKISKDTYMSKEEMTINGTFTNELS